jgi:hypothetical protein
MHSLAGGFEGRSHDARKHRAILGEESRTIFFAGFRTRLRLRDSAQNGPNFSGSDSHRPVNPRGLRRAEPSPVRRVKPVYRSDPMAYAVFSNDAKLSKAYPTEADVWKHARLSGLVIDVASEEDKAAPRPVLDNDYEIKPCRPDPQEDPAKNQAEAERDAELEFQLGP